MPFDLIAAHIYCVIMLWYRVLLVRCLCRILGFRRAPLAVGRYVNLRTEIKPVATDQLLSTFLMQGQYLSALVFAHSSRIHFLLCVCVFRHLRVREWRYCLNDFSFFWLIRRLLSLSLISAVTLSVSRNFPLFKLAFSVSPLDKVMPCEHCLIRVWLGAFNRRVSQSSSVNPYKRCVTLYNIQHFRIC